MRFESNIFLVDTHSTTDEQLNVVTKEVHRFIGRCAITDVQHTKRVDAENGSSIIAALTKVLVSEPRERVRIGDTVRITSQYEDDYTLCVQAVSMQKRILILWLS
jgi:hypothetical protein